MFVDAHTHLDHFKPKEIDDVFAEINSLPCKTWAVSMDIESWEKTQEIAAGRPNITPTFGIHPWNAHLYADRLDELDEPTADSPHIGEIGLDFHWVEEKERWPLQEIVLDYFLQKAAEQNKIVNLHTKGAEGLILKKLHKFKIDRAIVHWYSGDVATYKHRTYALKPNFAGTWTNLSNYSCLAAVFRKIGPSFQGFCVSPKTVS